MQEFHLYKLLKLIYFREGKYAEDLLTNSSHATKSQNQTENRIQIEYKPLYEQFVNKDISFDKQVLGEMVFSNLSSITPFTR